MNVNLEYCDPFLMKQAAFWMKIEHCGRYLWAAEFLRNKNCKRIADFACASGYGTYILADETSAEYIFGADVNIQCIEFAKKYYFHQGIEYKCMDFDETDFNTEEKFDAIVSFETLEHVNYPQNLLDNFFNILTSKGWLVISVPNESYERFDEYGNNRDPFHKSTFSKKQMIDLLERSGFEIRDILGQSACNYAMMEMSKLKAEHTEDQLEEIYPNNKVSIELFSKVIGMPCGRNLDDTYSYLFVCQKG